MKRATIKKNGSQQVQMCPSICTPAKRPRQDNAPPAWTRKKQGVVSAPITQCHRKPTAVSCQATCGVVVEQVDPAGLDPPFKHHAPRYPHHLVPPPPSPLLHLHRATTVDRKNEALMLKGAGRGGARLKARTIGPTEYTSLILLLLPAVFSYSRGGRQGRTRNHVQQ